MPEQNYLEIPIALVARLMQRGPIYAAGRIRMAEETAQREVERAAQLINERAAARSERNEAHDARHQAEKETREVKAAYTSLAAEHDEMVEAADTQRRETAALQQATQMLFDTAPEGLTMQQARRRAAVIAMIASDNDLNRY